MISHCRPLAISVSNNLPSQFVATPSPLPNTPILPTFPRLFGHSSLWICFDTLAPRISFGFRYSIFGFPATPLLWALSKSPPCRAEQSQFLQAQNQAKRLCPKKLLHYFAPSRRQEQSQSNPIPRQTTPAQADFHGPGFLGGLCLLGGGKWPVNC